MMISHREERRPRHIDRGAHDEPQHARAGRGGCSWRIVEDVLDQHHRAVDQDAEVDRAHRDQVGRQAERVQADERDQQRKRDDDATIERARTLRRNSQTTRHHEHEAEQQVVVHRRQRVADEVACGRRTARSACLSAGSCRSARGPSRGCRRARRVGFSPRRSSTKPSTPSLVGCSRRRRGAACATARRRATSPTVTGVPSLALEHDALDVLRRFDVADAADGELLVAVPQEAAADVDGWTCASASVDVGEREAVREQARGIDLDVHFLQIAAEASRRRRRPAPGAARARRSTPAPSAAR